MGTTSVGFGRARAGAIRAPVFLGSLTRKTGGWNSSLGKIRKPVIKTNSAYQRIV